MKGFAKRTAEVGEYYFSIKLKEVKRLTEEGHPVINMGIGNPDLPPHPSVIGELQDSAAIPSNHGYQGYQGIPELRIAMSEFYRRHYAVDKDPQSEILPLIGSKEGIMHISMTFLNEGDEVLVPDPGYPTYSSVTKLLGAKVKPYALLDSNAWYPDFDLLEQQDLSQVKLMWCNYPHMPSGAKADISVFEKLVSFAKKHQIVLVHDNPYSFVLEDSPKSIFQAEGAEEVALELNSLSKSSNMAGWRIGMAIGRKDWIAEITKVKSNMDSGMFLPLQKGAIAAMGIDEDWFEQKNQVYGARRKLIWRFAELLGLEFKRDTAGMFVWAKLPSGISGYQFVDVLLEKAHIFTAPGEIFGTEGHGYVRFSLCIAEEKILDAIKRIESIKPIF
ncbi:pyridoxal phosphate-dependent aminotransferase [Arthrospiribacter ruber]|uniref:Aminotransferase class I/II-fold pyridoxal phosphate-dependent enzyme n=1 Tax=Arthrospiribacter ruber TaxID=2487934 RepID=A0A951MED3_9BACT|nr:aminotransferase class I/II-fold pyridoxal phosphate-dependent enzyme [Arthrospiribacter ruber]MBW3469629.1 aminotransferase class I/II-fold pyridoxal phosphate-dependent enzyme [Arthrospiribacter ruber]